MKSIKEVLTNAIGSDASQNVISNIIGNHFESHVHIQDFDDYESITHDDFAIVEDEKSMDSEGNCSANIVESEKLKITDAPKVSHDSTSTAEEISRESNILNTIDSGDEVRM